MKTKNVLKRTFIVLSIVLLIAIIQYIPALLLETPDMQTKEGQYVIVYYQKGDERGAQEVFDLLELTSEKIRKKLEFSEPVKTKMYIYKKQSTFQIKKVGYITLFVAPEWYVGDNKEEIALMVSPYAKVSVHDHDSILFAAPHEMIHTINHLINPKLSYWIDNGVAGYLSNQVPQNEDISWDRVPSFQDIQTENEIKFGDIGGYGYSYSYIEYLDKTYGWEKIVRVVKGESYQDVFSKSEKDIYDEWLSIWN